MKYEKIHKAKFLERPNRFIAKVELRGRIETVHVKNTGRCRELLKEGATVYLNEPSGRVRKTKFDLVAVEKKIKSGEKLLINMDSSAPNDAAAEWLPKSGLFSSGAVFQREVKKGNSRFDFCVRESSFSVEEGDLSLKDSACRVSEDKERITYLEVKGVTLEKDGTVMFPDAPTERGVKHLSELSALCRDGFGAAVLFVVQMKGAAIFTPNKEMHPEFAEALKSARENGVRILVYDCNVTADTIEIDKPITLQI